MTAPLLIPLPGNESFAEMLAARLNAERGSLEVHTFPDGESYVRHLSSLEGRRIFLLCTLDRPDSKFLPLIFAAAAARAQGGIQVGLVAPYLAYMRQDRRFRSGEAITSSTFAELVSCQFDWLVTIDPHLHRWHALSEIYRIPSRAVHAAPLVARWIASAVDNPILIGPDSESAQWVADIAAKAGAPYIVLEKIRRGDRDVEVSVPEVVRWRDRTPVLVDDIVSTARTMIETIGHVRIAGMRPPVCVAIHGVFSGAAYDDLLAAGAARVVTSNAIRHPSNDIDVSGLLADAVRSMD